MCPIQWFMDIVQLLTQKLLKKDTLLFGWSHCYKNIHYSYGNGPISLLRWFFSFLYHRQYLTELDYIRNTTGVLLLTISEHLGWPPVFGGICITHLFGFLYIGFFLCLSSPCVSCTHCYRCFWIVHSRLPFSVVANVYLTLSYFYALRIIQLFKLLKFLTVKCNISYIHRIYSISEIENNISPGNLDLINNLNALSKIKHGRFKKNNDTGV